MAGALRGRMIAAPPGQATRPTADRVRQSLFDMLMHAPWAGAARLEGAVVLDAYAGSGALGLEALSRGAAGAVFMERDRAALAAIRTNVAALGLEARARVLLADVLHPPPGPQQGLALLDPPYGKDLLAPSCRALRQAGWLGPGSLVAAEIGRNDPLPNRTDILTNKLYGTARIVAWIEA